MPFIDNGIILNHGKQDFHDPLLVHEDEEKTVSTCKVCGTAIVTNKKDGATEFLKPTWLTGATEEDYRR